MKDTDKVTLTFGQLKQLVEEARCKNRKCKNKILKEYEIDDEGYDDEGNFVGLDAKDRLDKRHNAFWVGDGYDVETPYQRRKRGKYREDWGDLPGYGDPETWGGRKPR